MTKRLSLCGLMLVLLLSGCSGVLPGLSPPASQNAGVMALLDQSDQEAAAGRLSEAGASLERALRIEPRNPVLWQRLAQLRLEQGDYRQAENLAAKSNALALDERRLRADNWQIIGQARLGLGDQDGAQRAFEKARSW